MKDIAPQFRVIPVVECPQCGRWTEASDGADRVTCDDCRIEVGFAEPDVERQALAA